MRIFVDDKHFMAENPMPHKYAITLTEKINEIIDHLNGVGKELRRGSDSKLQDNVNETAKALRKVEEGVEKSIAKKPGRKRNVRPTEGK